jgi:alginate O-acetyltransferase complex protein AlgI
VAGCVRARSWRSWFALVVFRDVPELSRVWMGRALPWRIPLGISFLVLRLIGVVLDASALRIPVGARRMLLLSTFFPTYRSGPITTLQSFQALPPDTVDAWRGADRVVLGLARKCLLADLLMAPIVTTWSTAGADWLTAEQCLLFPFLIGLWIYWDFAGYSDIAIGLAALLGYQVPENFDRPYWSRNAVEFWRRWHITLSEWIRSRVFLKLTGRRPSPWRVGAAVMTSLALCGLWHGPRAGFLVWGLWHGVGVSAALAVGAAERRYPGVMVLLESRWTTWIAIGATYVWVNLGWLPFQLGVEEALRVARKAAPGVLHLHGLLLMAAFMAMLSVLSGVARAAERRWIEGAPAPIRGAAYALVLAAMFASGSPPFVYFRF